jgi:hypothetical protein
MKQGLFVFIIFTTCAALFGQTSSLTLSNNDSVRLFYSLDPNFNISGSSSLDHAGSISNFQRLNFTSLSPGAAVRLDGLEPGTHTLIGFWATETAGDFKVWNLQFTLESGQIKTVALTKNATNFYSGTNENITMKRPPSTRIVIDNNYSDWDEYPAIAVFPPAFVPAQFTYQSKEGEKALAIRNSNFWNKAGTRLDSVKAVFTKENFSIYFSSSTPFSPGLSLFLYLFDERISGERNLYTIEIAIQDDSGRGKVILWERGKDSYTEIGAFAATSFSLEARIDLSALPVSLKDNFYEKYSFDLKTCYFDRLRGFYEEFFFTSVYCRDVYFLQ